MEKWEDEASAERAELSQEGGRRRAGGSMGEQYW